MSNETQHTPADVRERIKAAIREGVRYVAKADGAYLYEPSVDETADRILSLLRTPRGEGEAMDADEMWNHWTSGHEDAALQGLRTATDDEAHRFLSMLADWQRCPKPSDHDAIAALHSDAQAEDRWEDLIFGTITEAYTEAPGDGPVGAACANCGDPNAAIAGGELDPDEAVCSVECYEQLRELGCPQEHGGTYRPKPARRRGKEA